MYNVYEELFNLDQSIGTVFEVTPNMVKMYIGDSLGDIEVGKLIFIECVDVVVIGKVISIRLLEKEEFFNKQQLDKENLYKTMGTVQLLATIHINYGTVEQGIKRYPCVGNKVYLASPQLVSWVTEASIRKQGGDTPLTLNIANLLDYTGLDVRVLPEQLFNRHCAILGTTGGGKSWTIARLIEETAQYHSKIILLDPSGEYHSMQDNVKHLHFGTEKVIENDSTEIVFPYSSLTENDLFVIFKPTGLQIPKLRAAMKSLKLARLEPSIAKNGVIVKANQPKEIYEQLYLQYAHITENCIVDFDITKLPLQIDEECIWLSNRTFPNKWGGYNNDERSTCVSLLSRIEDVLNSPELACVFQPQGKRLVLTEIDDFLVDERTNTLRISLENVSFLHNTREVIANALGRYILGKAREGCFINQPVVVFLDEAHHFLKSNIAEENMYKLDSFELIAKEGRKFSLNLCVATQRPRDIPEGVLSQMGTMITHRLINEHDIEIVEKACGEFNKTLTAFLPDLVPGEVMILGVDFPLPVTMKIREPLYQPDSMGPSYQKNWR